MYRIGVSEYSCEKLVLSLSASGDDEFSKQLSQQAATRG